MCLKKHNAGKTTLYFDSRINTLLQKINCLYMPSYNKVNTSFENPTLSVYFSEVYPNLICF